MTKGDPYEQWKQARRWVEAPEDFADNVMAAVRAHEAQRRAIVFTLFAVLARSRSGRIALSSLAVLACAFRLSQVITVFMTQ